QSELAAASGFRARAIEAALEIIELLAAKCENAVALRNRARQGTQFIASAIEEANGRGRLPAAKTGEGRGEIAPHRHRLFRRRRGGWRAEIGGMIDQGPIRLVANRRDERHEAARRRAHDDFLVETPQILERTAAARDDNHIGPPQGTLFRQAI